MRNSKAILNFCYCLVLIFLFITQPVYAYLDPGTGSLVIQLAIATFVAAGAFIKIKWSVIKKFFSKDK